MGKPLVVGGREKKNKADSLLCTISNRKPHKGCGKKHKEERNRNSPGQ